jgi:hypothetical protein
MGICGNRALETKSGYLRVTWEQKAGVIGTNV